MRRSVAVAAAVSLLAAGCGAGSAPSTTAASAAPVPRASFSPAATKAQIRRTWTLFFDGRAPIARRLSLLHRGGNRLALSLRAEARTVLAPRTAARVERIVLHGRTRATVVYTILVDGSPALRHARGKAVRAGGRWKVAPSGACALLRLQGAPPPPC